MKVTALQSVAILVGGTGSFLVWETVKGNPKFYTNVLMPTLHSFMSAEAAHNLAVTAMGSKFWPKSKFVDPECLHTTVWHRGFKNPLGIAAGFDKHAEAMEGLENLGFGFIEVGSITPLPQDGNAKPRVFRLSEDKAVINRYGFNSCGHGEVRHRLALWRKEPRNVILGINLGKNKKSSDHIEDYATGVKNLGEFADYIVINVSSPNTPGLRLLQQKSHLKEISSHINKERNKLSVRPLPALLIKLSPDLAQNDVQDIAEIVMEKECGIDGLIISNTTKQRPAILKSKYKTEIGGLSGSPLRTISTDLIRQMYKLTNGKIPLVGVGGVSTGEEAYEKIKAGASLVQIYTSLVYDGPPVVIKIKSQLAELLMKDGFTSVADAVGSDHSLQQHLKK